MALDLPYPTPANNGEIAANLAYIRSFVNDPANSTGGSQGPKGEPGKDGIDGLPGRDGAEGQRGPAGADSTVPGPKGDTGSQGLNGDTGDTGATGAQGSPGNNAPTYQLLADGTTAIAFATNACSKVTPTATATFTTTVPAAGTICALIILTSGTTSRTITFGTGFKTTGTLATGTTSGKVFTLVFISDGTTVNQIARSTAM